MKLSSQADEVLFISSYPPRACGIATYSKDLIDAVHNKFSKSLSIKVCALEHTQSEKNYPPEVKFVLKTAEPENYFKTAEAINENLQIKKVFIQHEFGLFGGQYGAHLLYLIYFLRKPVSITFHTVLPNPEKKRKKIVQTIASISEEIVVMTERSAKILQEDYDIPRNKIIVIHHGTHNIKWKNKTKFKEIHQLENRLVMSTFGLLSSNKNIETALHALPAIAEKFPQVLYLILGRTHPGVVLHEGEKYRMFLQSTVKKLGLENNVLFIDKYFNLPELLEYLSLTDVYLFTSKDPHQAVSGTFAYAMSAACPVISTPIPHAKEMLINNTGFLFDFENSEALSVVAIDLLNDQKLREEMGLNAFQQTRISVWENVAISHAKLFAKYISTQNKLQFDLPEIHLNHIHALTDERGIIQFAKINEADIESGYTLDDNARALIATLLHYEKTNDPTNLLLIEKYLDFIQYCQQPAGNFLNYVDKHGYFHSQNDYNNLEDSNGRAIWAIGFTISYSAILPISFLNKADNIMRKILSQIPMIDSPRAISFAIKGLCFYSKERNDMTKIANLIESLADKLVNKFFHVSTDNWKWFETYLTYANSVIPEALLYAYQTSKKIIYKDVAQTSFEFLLTKTFSNGRIKVISNRGWHHKDNISEQYGEQPIDVSYTILALELFYKVFRSKDYLEKMESAFSWFLGKNHLDQIVYNPLTGGCHDGLEKNNINLNQGAESTVCYLIARLIVERNKILALEQQTIPANKWNNAARPKRKRIFSRAKIHKIKI